MRRQFRFGSQPALDRATFRCEGFERALTSAKKQLAIEKERCDAAEKHVASVRAQISQCVHDGGALVDRGATISELTAHEIRSAYLRNEERAGQRTLIERRQDVCWAEARVAQFRGLLAKSMAAEQALQKMRDEAYRQFRRGIEKAEEKRRDDLVLARLRC